MRNPRLLRGACTMGMLEAVKRYLDENPSDLHSWEGFPHSWLGEAASSNRLDVIEELIRRGLDARRPEAGGDALAMGAAYPAVVRLLLGHGAPASAPGVMIAAAAFATPDIVELLLDHGGDPYHRHGRPPRNAFEQAEMSGRLDNLAVLQRHTQRNDSLVATMADMFGASSVGPSPLDRPTGSPFGLYCFDLGSHVVVSTVGLSRSALAGPGTAEVFVRLPAGWPRLLEQEPWLRWPIDWLFSVVHAAFEDDVLQPFHTIGNGEPPDPVGGDYVGSAVIPEFVLRHGGGVESTVYSLLFLTVPELARARTHPEAFFANEEDPALRTVIELGGGG